MKIQIQERNAEVSEVLRAHVARRLGIALGRFGERVGRVIVRFSDISDHNGHQDGADKRCQIDVDLRPRSVRVEDTNTDLFAAVDHAAGRVSRSVARALERELERDEGRSRPRTARGSKS